MDFYCFIFFFLTLLVLCRGNSTVYTTTETSTLDTTSTLTQETTVPGTLSTRILSTTASFGSLNQTTLPPESTTSEKTTNKQTTQTVTTNRQTTQTVTNRQTTQTATTNSVQITQNGGNLTEEPTTDSETTVMSTRTNPSTLKLESKNMKHEEKQRRNALVSVVICVGSLILIGIAFLSSFIDRPTEKLSKDIRMKMKGQPFHINTPDKKSSIEEESRKVSFDQGPPERTHVVNRTNPKPPMATTSINIEMTQKEDRKQVETDFCRTIDGREEKTETSGNFYNYQRKQSQMDTNDGQERKPETSGNFYSYQPKYTEMDTPFKLDSD